MQTGSSGTHWLEIWSNHLCEGPNGESMAKWTQAHYMPRDKLLRSRLCFQVFPTFVIAGLGMVAAGLVLNHVQEWKVFRYTVGTLQRLRIEIFKHVF
jgi:hypothetical protein